ncbi:uncharacterized protein KIAA0825-like isoform X2 [Babylonia areolata]|uniref:uncharacterized protein KIAA0825-like isoform X2 n=1 Tax=Babylonia areolata TaxID=304850 RepID=UPI003FD04C3A
MATLNTSNSTTQEPLDDRLRRLPPFHAVFEAGGPPTSPALQLYLANLDNTLEENSRQLDSCLQGLLRFTNDLPGERTFASPKDGLLHMYNSHVLEKDSCYDPEIEEAIIILDALLHRLEKEAGSEEDVLQEVLILASSEGLMLPLRMSALEAPDHALVSSASLHAIMDSSDQIIEQRWNRLASTLKKYLSDQLSQLPLAVPGTSCSSFCLDRRMELVESLRVLCSDDSVWLKYKALRLQQQEDLFAKLMPEVEEEGVSYKDFARNCGTVADSVIAMIDEDFVILNSGMFRKVTGVFRALHELYLEKFSDEMSLLVDEIGDEVAKNSQRVFTQSSSEHGLHKNNVMGSSGKSKDIIHRNSVGGLSNTKEGGAMAGRGQAQSLDSMFSASSTTTTTAAATAMAASAASTDRPAKASAKSRCTFPEDCMQALLNIVLALMRLEDHIDRLLRSVTWDITGLPPKKSRRKTSIRGVLKPTASPEAARYTAQSLQYQQSGSFSSSDTQLDLFINSPHGDMAAAPKVVEHSRVEEKFRWEWKLVFKKLSVDLSQAVEGRLLDQMHSCLAAETALWDSQHVLKAVPTLAALQGGRVEYPMLTSLGSHQFLEVANRLLPLARVGCDGCLLPVRSSFIDTFCICLKNFHVQLVKMSKDVPGKASLKQLYLILATCGMIRNHLMHYENLLTTDDGGKKLFTTLVRQYSELLDAVMKQIVQLHSQTVATSILMDAESTDWANFKDFYEDERCSFTIQMWNFHLRGLRHDLWTTCAPTLAQSIFSSVLQDSLLTIMQRYMRVLPSFRRVKQYKYDVTAILLCVMDHLLWASNSASRLLDPGHSQLPHYSIHNLCSNLMAALAIVASPLDAVYRVYRRGFSSHQEELSSQESMSRCGNTQWMHFFWPALFASGGHKHYDDMQTTSALYLQLMLLLRQPQSSWGLLVQALLMKEYTLSVILLSRSLMMASSHHSHSESLDSSNGDEAGQGSGSRSGGPGVEEPASNARKVVFALVGVLAHAHQFPSALAKCVLPAVERCDDWELFNVKTTSAELKPPLWMEALFSILSPLLEKILEPMLFFLLKEKCPDAARDSVSSRLQDLPCGCQSNAADAAATWPGHHAVPAKDLVRRCLELLIESTQQNMFSLSGPVCLLFHTLQSACTQRNIKTTHSCVGIQMLAWSMWKKMKNLEGMQAFVGLPLLPHHQHHLSLLADFYYQIMVFGKAKGGGTPRLASKFHKTHKEWLPLKVEAITKYLARDIFSEPESDILEGATSVFADQVAMEVAAAVMATPRGAQDLRLLYNLISNNRDWLFQQLDVTLPLPGAGKTGGATDPKTLKFCVHLGPPPEEIFVPTVEQNRIGACSFDQEAIANFSVDWMAMLTSDLGLSEHSFLNLLRNRHEMQPGAVLDDTEKKLVDALRTAFNL